MTELAQWLSQTALSQYILGSAYAFPVFEVIHVIAISLVVGTIFFVDLRLLDLYSKAYPVRPLLRALLPYTVGGFLTAAISGFFLFAAQPVSYLATPAFQVKLALLALAGINVALFHLWIGRSPGLAEATEGSRTPLAARASGLVSLSLWVTILIAGRFVGFTLVPV